MNVASLSKPHYDEEGYDKLVCDLDKNIFGVFDGMGVSDGSRFASRIASELFVKLCNGRSSVEDLADAIKQMAKVVGVRPSAGTTCTIVNINDLGYLQYAHVGDGRLYVIYKDRIKQITADEGIGNILYNYVGMMNKGVFQLGEIQDWEKFMLCTDGITGDWPEEVLSDIEIERILLSSSPEQACRTLIKKSRKLDDKSIIIGHAT